MEYALEQLQSLLEVAQEGCHENLQDAQGFAEDGDKYFSGYNLGRSDAYALMAKEIEHVIARLEKPAP